MLIPILQILAIIVIGALLFWAIDKWCEDGRLAKLLKILVVIIIAIAVLIRLMPLLGVSI